MSAKLACYYSELSHKEVFLVILSHNKLVFHLLAILSLIFHPFRMEMRLTMIVVVDPSFLVSILFQTFLINPFNESHEHFSK